MRTIYSDSRKSGIPIVGNLPWGSHFCQFYQTKNDLLDILVPYFKAGLENNELCIWVTYRPLGVGDAKKALAKAIPDLNNYAGEGRIEIVPYSRWQARGKDPGDAIVSMLDKAMYNGFDGLRLACNAVPEKKGSRTYTCFGSDVIGRYNVIAAFEYPRDVFDAAGLMQVVNRHRFALVRNADRWEVIESSEARIVNDALKRSEEKLQSLFSNMSEGFAYHRIILDAGGKPRDYVFLEVNEAFERLTGLQAKDVIGRRGTEAIPGLECDRTDWIGKYGKVALTGEPSHFESYSEVLGKWYSVSAFSPHKGYFAVNFSDITERKRAEERIRHQSSIVSGINRVFQGALTCNTEEDLGQTCLAVVKELTQSQFGFIGEIGADGLLHDIAISNPGWELCKLHNKEGHRRPPGNLVLHGLYGRVLLSGKSLLTNSPSFHPDSTGIPAGHPNLTAFLGIPLILDGRIMGIIALANREGGYRQADLEAVEALSPAVAQAFARKRAQEELRRAHDELELRVQERTSELSSTVARLELINQELQEFAYVASHDLQEPLRKIQTFCDMAQKRCLLTLDHAGQEYLERVTSSASRMRQLLDDLLQFSRVADRPEPFKKVGLTEIVREASEVFEKMINETGAIVAIEDLPDIEADETQILRLFQNLFGNALKFRRDENPRISVFAKQDGRMCEISVTDNGIGFDQQFAERIFKPFQRLHKRSEYDGTGMGLAICRKIAERHGGSIRAESVEGKGSTFIVRLPMRQDRHAAPAD